MKIGKSKATVHTSYTNPESAARSCHLRLVDSRFGLICTGIRVVNLVITNESEYCFLCRTILFIMKGGEDRADKVTSPHRALRRGPLLERLSRSLAGLAILRHDSPNTVTLLSLLGFQSKNSLLHQLNEGAMKLKGANS